MKVELLLCLPVAYFGCLLAWGIWMQHKHGKGKGPSGP